MALSKNFRTLMEDLRNPSDVYEDRDTRRERREQRRTKRKEGRFMDDSSDDFNINSFIDSVTVVKNGIVGILKDCDDRLSSKVLGGKKAAEKYKPEFLRLLQKAAVLIGEASYRKNQGEGRKLEKGDTKGGDLAAIESFREGYQTLVSEFDETMQSYNEEKSKLVIDKLDDIDFPQIQEPLTKAEIAFTKAFDSSLALANDIKVFVAQGSTTNTSTSSTVSTGSTVVASSIKIEKPIKGGTTPTGENAEITKKVFALICEKWKESKTLTATDVWKKSGFCGPNKLIIGPSRTACIKAIKAAYGIQEQNGDLTQELVDKLSASEVIKESQGFPKFSQGKLLSFENFLTKRTGVSEGIDLGALKNSLGKNSSSTVTTRDKVTTDTKKVEGPFKSKEEGDAFRKWVNDTHKDWATANKLDVTGSHTNSFIMKAWNKFKDEYGQGQGKKEDNKKADGKVDPSQVETVAQEAENLLLTGSDKIVELFSDASFWSEFKGKFDDNEEKAQAAFYDWWDSTLVRKYIKPAKSKIGSLPDSEEKELVNKMMITLEGAKAKIHTKLGGETYDDTFTWKLYTLSGDVKNYKIDTDF